MHYLLLNILRIKGDEMFIKLMKQMENITGYDLLVCSPRIRDMMLGGEKESLKLNHSPLISFPRSTHTFTHLMKLADKLKVLEKYIHTLFSGSKISGKHFYSPTSLPINRKKCF